ncbi:hypothetical protein N7510_002739 [Penicillium lagena]|uniref:uncharacterized protein n=1 Tax=Penicillium lagena TaxID=94218 RepID=UPI0025406ADD|nr:uncharacterized protein N7510_002739 [Penicillium lagena]KAJ5618755.1 hypothetical protein N7510_002739 [Penicillium lagena]
MPPLRSGRASKACDLCRKNKTRCYANEGVKNTCLRCHTLSLPCSLEDIFENRSSSPTPERQHRREASLRQASPNRFSSTDARQLRLDRLERTVAALVNRLDSQLKDNGNPSGNTALPRTEEQSAPSEKNPAPVFLIRDAANDAGISSSEQLESRSGIVYDVISAGLDTSTDMLLTQVRNSPLLLCSVLLIAVRHTTQDLADELAPRLFREAKRLVSSSLLIVPQSIEHFQAMLILSLWSTTIGQVPLSIDSWLLTGYALQQGFASSCFPDISKLPLNGSIDNSHIDAWFLWNHLCAILTQAHVDRCHLLVESGNLRNYEARMVAEVKLYWVIYEKCCGLRVNLSDAKLALQNWKKQWASLFDEPRSQFLQMGFQFAHLLAYYQSVRSPQTLLDGSVIMEMIDLSSSIINLAIDTTDDRTRHLTDHIYHIVTFSALTLCRLVHTYDAHLRVAKIDVDGLDRFVVKLITWLRSIGLPCHAAHLLSDIVSFQFKKLRHGAQQMPENFAFSPGHDHSTLSVLAPSPLSSNIGFLYPDLIGSELFYMDDGTAPWPQWS